MLVQQFQRPTRLLAIITATCLVYLSYNYLQRLEFSSTCVGDRIYDGPFGTTRLLSAAPATIPHHGSSRVAKVGVAVNALDIPVVHRAFKTHEVHNEMHGYAHYIADKEVVSNLIDNDRMHRGAGAYTKPAYMLAIMIAELLKPEEERLQWLFWFDGDTMILNPSTPLETFLPPANTSTFLDEVHLVISANWDGLNSGVFAMRVHPWSVSLLSGVLGYPMYERERTRKDRFRDQSAFQFLLTNPQSPLANDKFRHSNHWVKVPMRWFNSLPVNNAFYANGKWLFSNEMTNETFEKGTTELYDDGHAYKINPWKVMRGDLVVHFAGTKNVRDSWMGPWLDRAEALLPEWNNATYSAELKAQVADFWEDWEYHAQKLFVEPPPEEKKPEQKKPEQKKPEEKKPEQKKPEEKKPEENKPEEKKVEEKKVEEKKPEEQKSEEKQPEEKKSEENKSEEKPTANSNANSQPTGTSAANAGSNSQEARAPEPTSGSQA